MKILVTNDDGIYASGMWALVGELSNFAEVVVVAPDREQSATAASITLHHPLRLQKVKPEVTGIETYTIGGTPGDCTVLAINHLIKDKLDLIISGINNGPNIGVDVFQSGTVGGALQGYLHGLPAIAVSIDEVNSQHFQTAAEFTATLVKKINTAIPEWGFLLNINVPALPLNEIRGIRITQLSKEKLADQVEEGHDGRRQYYWLKYQKVNSNNNVSKSSDLWALSHKFISISPLHRRLFGDLRLSQSDFMEFLRTLRL
jgi:5'-nucleotidase